MKPFSEQTYYELLDIAPYADSEEIKSAFARANELYAEDSIAIYSLAEPEAAAELRRRVLEAFEYLSDPELRAEYDRSIGVEPRQAPPPAAEPSPMLSPPPAAPPPLPPVQMALVDDFAKPALPPPPLPALRMTPVETPAVSDVGPVQVARQAVARSKPIDIPSDAEINGELLRQCREAKGMSLSLLAERTKISARHIENVEADRYDALPATVYLRGILMSMAKELGLDPMRVSKSYLALIK